MTLSPSTLHIGPQFVAVLFWHSSSAFRSGQKRRMLLHIKNVSCPLFFLSFLVFLAAEDARRRKARRGVQLPFVPPHGGRHVLVRAHVAGVRRHGRNQGTRNGAAQAPLFRVASTHYQRFARSMYTRSTAVVFFPLWSASYFGCGRLRFVGVVLFWDSV